MNHPVSASQPAAAPSSVAEPSLPSRPVPRSQPASSAPKFFAAMGNPLRWKMVKMLADGRGRTATDVAAVLKRDFDGISKHLRVLRAGGVIQSRRGEDRRLEVFFIPEAHRPQPGVLQLGFVRMDLTASQGLSG